MTLVQVMRHWIFEIVAVAAAVEVAAWLILDCTVVNEFCGISTR